MTDMSTSAPQARYGSRRSRGVSGKFVVIGVVVLVIAVGVYVAAQYRNSTAADVNGTAAGWTRPDGGDSLRLTLDITRDDPSQPGYCVVTALDYGKNEVGRREAVVASGGDSTTRLIIDIPTHGEPVAGQVYGCSSVLPSYLPDRTTESVA
ncbi:DUF4307 domain-containing protein [Corynebacterium bovis]|uniref:DUF4307 domain-containing protein n=2 Tax=Corynebacterium bovis TaxID=36808 RepID=A0A3R8PGT8_9CORY|nr:DUF4307 domain-containing protein [Corynebacterium bovis]WJY77229.1 hypothetical protein CBOVI_03475 [Corynebacterium bovis DSM 20582 = CIP 54.80]RRO81954.1 DUF4307 domain-containing protein [Corynebacterium bovis]RRO84039.1 DUF4307 domain-containing protein [Corynebacterium bovis]RRO85142.1 DUF4307 domain-containing protein [Corynebacterium bovis]